MSEGPKGVREAARLAVENAEVHGNILHAIAVQEIPPRDPLVLYFPAGNLAVKEEAEKTAAEFAKMIQRPILCLPSEHDTGYRLESGTNGIEYVFDRSTAPPPKERRDEDDPPYAGVLVHCCRDYSPRGGRLVKKLTDTSWLVEVGGDELIVHEPDEVWG